MANSREFCFVCENTDSPLSFLSEVVVKNEDGEAFKPLDVFLKFVDSGRDLAAEEKSKCCQICIDEFYEFLLLEWRLARLRVRLEAKLSRFIKHRSQQDVDNFKRRRRKTAKMVLDENEDIQEEEKELEKVELDLLSDEEWSKLEQQPDLGLNSYLSQVPNVSSKCVMSRVADCRSHCLSKTCDLEAVFKLDSDKKSLEIVSRGKILHPESEDPRRITFELTKQEFHEQLHCEFCAKRFSSEQEIANHRQRQPTETVHKCPDCSADFKNFQARNNHFLNTHTTDAPYFCSKNQDCCDSKPFKTRYKLTQHERGCNPGLRFPCPKCDKIFSSKRNLKDHNSIVHEKDKLEYGYECGDCGKKFYKKSNYSYHVLKHNKSTLEIIQCPIEGCEVKFKRVKSLRSHLANKHPSQGLKKSYLCSKCGKQFESISGYKQHQSKHIVGGQPYIKREVACQSCGKKFRSQSDLRIHSVVHTKDKNFVCDICNAQFTQKASLKDHYNMHLKKFQCTLCKKAFGRQRYLDSHVKGCGQPSKTAATTTVNAILQEAKLALVEENHIVHIIPDQQHQVAFVQEHDHDAVLTHVAERGNTITLEYTNTK